MDIYEDMFLKCPEKIAGLLYVQTQPGRIVDLLKIDYRIQCITSCTSLSSDNRLKMKIIFTEDGLRENETYKNENNFHEKLAIPWKERYDEDIY